MLRRQAKEKKKKEERKENEYVLCILKFDYRIE